MEESSAAIQLLLKFGRQLSEASLTDTALDCNERWTSPLLEPAVVLQDARVQQGLDARDPLLDLVLPRSSRIEHLCTQFQASEQHQIGAYIATGFSV